MKKTPKRSGSGARKVVEMREEYDFGGGERGKHAGRVGRDAVLVALDPDVAEAFPTAAAVNRALRAIIEVAPKPPGGKAAVLKSRKSGR